MGIGRTNSTNSVTIGTDVSDTTAGTSDVKTGVSFYTADGIKRSGALDFSAADASAADVKKGKKFFSSGGTIMTGTLDFSSVTATAADVKTGKYFLSSSGSRTAGTLNFAAVTAETSDVASGEKFFNSSGDLVTGTAQLRETGAIYVYCASDQYASGTYILLDTGESGQNRIWVHRNSYASTSWPVHILLYQSGAWRMVSANADGTAEQATGDDGSASAPWSTSWSGTITSVSQL